MDFNEGAKVTLPTVYSGPDNAAAADFLHLVASRHEPNRREPAVKQVQVHATCAVMTRNASGSITRRFVTSTLSEV